MASASNSSQVRLSRISSSHCRVVFDNPPSNLMGPQFVVELGNIVTALEADEQVKVVVFESAVDGFFLNHSDFLGMLEVLTALPQSPTGLEAWPEVLARLAGAPFMSIAMIRGRAIGNGCEMALACDMRFASREGAVLSQRVSDVGLAAGVAPVARLARLIGSGRAFEALLAADDIAGDLAESWGYVNRSLPDNDLDRFVDALANRISSVDRWAIVNAKRLANAALV
jgi:enoyl-CoA hydratase/carnithine racemase